MNMKLIWFNTLFLLIFTSCSGLLSSKENTPYVYVSVDDDDYENMEALQLTKVMGNGINLGNTMDACGGGWIESILETLWMLVVAVGLVSRKIL